MFPFIEVLLVSLSVDKRTNPSTSGYHTMVNAATIANTKFISLEGVFYPKSSAQLITQLEINRAGSVVRYWTIQGVNFLQDNMIFFDDPITLDQNQPITIRGYNPTTSTNGAASPEEVVLIGTVVEKKGLTVIDYNSSTLQVLKN